MIARGRVAAALALAPGLSAIWATTLTRIGVVSSVHAFADQPRLRFGLVMVAFGVTAVAGILVARAQHPTVPVGPADRVEPVGPADPTVPVGPADP